MKKNTFNPFVRPTVLLGDDTVIGGGTGQGGVNPPVGPMSFSAWLASDWKEDLIQNGVIDEDDYAAWWESWGFTKEQWEYYNPDLPWEDYFG